MSVTAAGMTRDRRLPQRPRVLIGLLAISVALNLCVVAGVVWSRLHAPPPPLAFSERFHRLADTLDLTPQQRVAFDRYVADMAARGERLRQTVEPIMDAAWAELAKPDTDQAHVLQLLDEAGDKRRAFMHEAVGATLSLLATLTPDQRAKFLSEEHEFRTNQRRRRAEESH
jgi:Spy/CpxP family protein refolding chaperone